MRTTLNRRHNLLQIAASAIALLGIASPTCADIYQWEYINAADPSQGKRQSTTLAPDGAGVDAATGAYLVDRDLSMAHLIGANLAYGFKIVDDRAYLLSANLTGAILHRADLTDADLTRAILTNADFSDATLSNANLQGAILTDAALTGAEVRGANFGFSFEFTPFGLSSVGTGITLDQLYSTASYRNRQLTGMRLFLNNLSGANFVGQDLSNSDFNAATLTDADFTGAEVRGATLGSSFTLAQLYSTASYQARQLTGISLFGSDLSGGDFARQDLTNADFTMASLTDANFTEAEVRGASFGSNITFAQLTSTASYRTRQLAGLRIFGGDLSGGNFAHQNLSHAYLSRTTLTDADFSHANLANVDFLYATLTDADFTAADARGAHFDDLSPAPAVNLIRSDGHISGLKLHADVLVIRDYDGDFRYEPTRPAIHITVDQHASMDPDGALRIVFEADAWDSTISFAPGIPVTLGGALELMFADDVNPASQVGRTFDLFDWTGVAPVGAFEVTSPYQWDTSKLYTTGEVTLVAVPEPSAALLLLFAATIKCIQRRPNVQTRRTALFVVCVGCLLAGPTPAFGEFNLIEATIPQMQDAMESGETTSEGLVTKYLQRIANLDDAGPMLNAVLALNPHALETARALDAERLATGPRGPLHGIPILVKDNIDTFDQPTTAGALIFEGSIPPDDAFLVQKLRAAGAVILGKSNLTEFGNFVSRTMPHGFSTLGGQTVNPYGPGVLSPYGSSSGSAVSVAANLAAAAVGDETSGSIVAPAWANSVVGIRSTVGLVSRNGMIPVSHTQDTAGPLTRTVTDAAIMLGAMTGVDPNDPATLASVGKSWEDYTPFLNPDGLVGKRIGIVRFPHVLVMDPVDVPLANAAFDALEDAGAELVDNLDLSANLSALLNLWGPAYPKTLTHEFAHNIESYLASLGDHRPASTLAEIIAFNAANAALAIPFGQDILQEALATGGNLNDPAYIAERNEGIRLMGTDGIDALLDSNDLDALVLPYDWSVIGSVPGTPAIQVPAGFNDNGAPFSLGFVGKPFSEPELIEIAYAFEQATLLRRPPEVATEPADFNSDGIVDADDLAKWQGDFGLNDDSDADFDGDSDGADFLAWQRKLGSGPGSPPTNSIPEPSSVALAAAAIAMLIRRRS